MFENICMMKKIRVGVNAMSMRMRRLRLGCRGVKIMAVPYKKDEALCSPTSALKKKRMVSEELRNLS